MKEYLLLAAFMIPSLVVLAAAAVTLAQASATTGAALRVDGGVVETIA